MNIIIFEDGLHNNFYPLSQTWPLWELRSGLFSFRERLELFVNNNPHLSVGGIWFFTREYLAPWFSEKYPGVKINDYSVFESGGDMLFINAVRYPSEPDFSLEKNSMVMMDGVPVAARVDGATLRTPIEPIPGMLMKLGLRKTDCSPGNAGRKANFIWDLMAFNPDIIREDYLLAGFKGNGGSRKDVTITGDSGQVYIEEGAVFEPYAVIDATAGPVVIGGGSRILSFSRIEGPCAIGRECVILGARVRGGTSLGCRCRIGGEIEQSIFHGLSNKYHDGFIGHSYIGEWVNMGALTTNSDLKNNYTNVKVYIPDSRKKTGQKKVGCFMGDHVKTSIGTLINTGTSIGTGAMLVHSGGLTPFHIPPFSWYMNNAVSCTGALDDFIATCRESMSRRNVDISENYITLIRAVHALSPRE
jgi:UDP-N-acetylglucosamine diphosphorylase / glucose-1-phosphate thymidylyltransferase / UDP-N-acetylgalactosamine diphosphorylase / glucosamine-1-phosphate N-acetyltransferase / galactosamine-1-phosphate N-acetyltransferase